MYRSFETFSFSDERELRLPERIRVLERKRNLGMWVAVVLLDLGAVGCLALAVAGVYIKIADVSAPVEAGWIMMGIGLFFGLMMAFMASAFHKEIAMCALGGYLRSPQSYEFLPGRIVEATYLSDGKQSSARMLVKGSYGENGMFLEEFSPSVWSNAVAEAGEKEWLKPGDDRYSQKGKRVSLPIDVWVLHEIGAKTPAALVGIPAETVRLLTKK